MTNNSALERGGIAAVVDTSTDDDNTVDAKHEFTVARLITTPVISRTRTQVPGQYQRRVAFIIVKAFTAGEAVRKANTKVALTHETIWPNRTAPWKDHDQDWQEVPVENGTEPFVLRG
jgi:hypothetical protein